MHGRITQLVIGFACLSFIACDENDEETGHLADQGVGTAIDVGPTVDTGAAMTDGTTTVDMGEAADSGVPVDSAVLALDAAPVADARSSDAAPSPDAGFPQHCRGGEPAVVRVATEDGLMLVGDWYPGDGNGRAVVLLHMIPPNHTRQNYSPDVIAALTAHGFAVLNLDRRGAGDSPGVAREAYEGPNGALDAKGAAAYLASTGCVDATRVAWVGTSNGTTTVLDYTVAAGGDDALSLPAAIVYLTGGRYTENQNLIADHRALLDPITTRFVFSTEERAWSAAFDANPPAAWSFMEYDPGAHGTRMFGTRPESVTDFADFLNTAVSR